jgi:nucleolar protein 58
MVATKAALAIRVDALTDEDGKSEDQAPSLGIENRAKLESRLRALEHGENLGGVRRFADSGKKQKPFQMTGETKIYNTAADAVDLVSTQREPVDLAVKAVLDVKEEKRKAKEERRAKRRMEKEAKEKIEKQETPSDDEDMERDEKPKKEVEVKEVKKEKKEKKRKRRMSEEANVKEEAETSQVSFSLELYFTEDSSNCFSLGR